MFGTFTSLASFGAHSRVFGFETHDGWVETTRTTGHVLVGRGKTPWKTVPWTPPIASIIARE